MDPGLDGGELRAAGEDQGRHQGDLERRHPLGGGHRAEQKADGKGRNRRRARCRAGPPGFRGGGVETKGFA